MSIESFKKRCMRVLSLVIAIFVLVSSSASVVKAVTFDELFYSSNDIVFYDPRVQACTTNNESFSKVVGDDNAEIILRFFTGKGFSLAAAAGIAGNMWVESKFNPKVIQGGATAPDNYTMKDGIGFGLVQWTSGGRQQNLTKFAASKNTPITDVNTQLEFAYTEISTSYKDVFNRLNSEKSDPVAAAAIVHGFTLNIKGEGGAINPTFLAINPPAQGYESSGDTSEAVIKNRGGMATGYYQKWKAQIPDGTGAAGAESVTSSGSVEGTPLACGGNDPVGDIGVGKGSFIDTGEVAQWSTVMQNAQRSNSNYNKDFYSQGVCAAITSVIWHGGLVPYGVNTAISLWETHQSKYGHKDRNVKKGALLLYRSDTQAAGHVTIYLGNNKVLNDGKIDDASLVEGGWNLKYVGWIDPTDIGWKSKDLDANLTSGQIKSWMRGFGLGV